MDYYKFMKRMRQDDSNTPSTSSRPSDVSQHSPAQFDVYDGDAESFSFSANMPEMDGHSAATLALKLTGDKKTIDSMTEVFREVRVRMDNASLLHDELKQWYGGKTSYKCVGCNGSLRNLNAKCCEETISQRSNRQRLITIAEYSTVKQLENIVALHMDTLVAVHKEMHMVACGRTENTRWDRHLSNDALSDAETTEQFRSKQLKIALGCTFDAYPYAQHGRGNATPLLVSIDDLPSSQRWRRMNVCLAALIGGARGKYNAEIWKNAFHRMLAEINSAVITVSGWTIRFEVTSLHQDMDSIREAFLLKGWQGKTGLHCCLIHGEAVENKHGKKTSRSFPPAPAGVPRPLLRSDHTANVRDAKEGRNGFKGVPFLFDHFKLTQISCDSLHLIDIGVTTNALKYMLLPSSPAYLGKSSVERLKNLRIYLPPPYPTPRSFVEGDMIGMERAAHGMLSIAIIASDPDVRMDGASRMTLLAYSLYIDMYRQKHILDDDLDRIRHAANWMSTAWLNVFGKKAFTAKAHILFSEDHLPDITDRLGSPYSTSMNGSESINRLLCVHHTVGASRGYESEEAARFVVRGHVERHVIAKGNGSEGYMQARKTLDLLPSEGTQISQGVFVGSQTKKNQHPLIPHECTTHAYVHSTLGRIGTLKSNNTVVSKDDEYLEVISIFVCESLCYLLCFEIETFSLYSTVEQLCKDSLSVENVIECSRIFQRYADSHYRFCSSQREEESICVVSLSDVKYIVGRVEWGGKEVLVQLSHRFIHS